MRVRSLLFAAALALAACGPNPTQVIDPSQGSGCPDDGPRLPVTNICQGRAWAYLEPAEAARAAALPDGCTWAVRETLLAGDEALLYRAASCNGVTTTLTFAGGAHSASIAYETLPGDADAKGREVIRLFGTDPDPQGALKAAIAELPPAARTACAIAPAGVDGWPEDALVIKRADGGPAACGPFGADGPSATYWRIRQGYAWFFTLGQGNPGFDADTLTILARGPDGEWAVKP